MNLRELYWAAGFLEGEGCFHVGGRVVITAAQVQPEPLYRLQRLLGGKVLGPYKTKQPNHQPAFRWQLNGTDAVAVMMTLFCLMSEKRKAAISRAVRQWRLAPGNSKAWLARGYCKNGHSLTGANYVVAPSGHGRCRECGIQGRRRYYAKNKAKWPVYAAKKKSNVIPFKARKVS